MATAATSTPTAATAPLTLPKEILEVVAPTETFPTFRKKWLSNEEVVSLLISYNKHPDWLTTSIQERPPNGTVMLVNRKAVKYKKDGYCWKVRKDSTIIREDTMRLKIQCLEVLKCLYAHSSLVPTFHRRSYWLFINPDIVLVHYLNVNPEYTYSSLMGNPPPLFTLPNYWPSVRPWNKKELLSELSPMYEQCTNEDGTLPGGMKNMEDLISLIMEARKTAATTEESATGMPVKSNSNQSCKLTQCQKKDAGVLTGSKTNRGKNLDGGAVCEKYRPILASTGHNSKTMPLVLNIQPVLAVVQTKMAVSSLESAAATASTSESSTSEDRMIKSVSETSTQTCEDFVNDHSNEDSILLDCQTKKSNGCSSNPVSCCLSSSSSGSLAVDTAGCRITGRSNSTDISVVLRRSPSRVFARSSAFDELVTKASDYNFASFTTNQSRNSSSTEPSYSSPVQEAAVRSSIGCSVGATLLSPNSVFDSTAGGSPLESLSSCEHSFNPSQPPQSTLRSRSIGSDLGFSEGIDCFSPSLYFNNPSSVSTLMYDIASPSCSSSPLATGNKMQCQDATRGNVVTTAPRNDLPPTYDLSCYHCDSFSSCGPASSLSGGGINSSGSSNSVLTEHTNRSEAIPPVPTRTISNGGDEAPSFTESVLDSLETPYTREATQGTVSTNCSSADSYIPNFSSSDTIQGFSEMTTHHLSHAGLINDVTAAQNEEEVFSSATELPDLSSMADFNEQMCRLAPHAVSSSPTEFGTNGRGGVGVGDASHGFASLQQQQRSSLSVPTITHMLTFVTEYSPNWCYEEGGEKVLVAGNWLDLNSTDSFQCQFGDKVVPAALILPGVLRCLSPDFSQGVVPLSVLRNGTFLTHSVPFEYRLRLSLNDMNRSPFDVNSSSDYDWLALDDRQFRYRLLTRLNQMHNHLTRLVGNQFVTNQTSGTNSNNSNAPSADLFPSTECLSNFEMEFERKFVAILQIISQVQQACVGQPIVELPRPPRGLTMLHLAAALGMPRLIDMMRSSVSQLGSMCDLNPASLDDQHCSPLTWACARGNLECTLILHNWCHEMLHARNRLGLTPAMIAKQRGHILLVETLTEQVTGNSRNYKSTRGKRPCPININERGRQGPEGKQNATIPFNFVPMEPPDAMSSCSEYDSEDNCSLSSNALGEFGGMTLSEIEQLAFNEGFGNLGQKHRVFK